MVALAALWLSGTHERWHLEGSDLVDDDQGSPRRTRLRLANRRHLRLALATLEFRGHLPQPLDRLWEGMALSRAVSLRKRCKGKLKPHSLKAPVANFEDSPQPLQPCHHVH